MKSLHRVLVMVVSLLFACSSTATARRKLLQCGGCPAGAAETCGALSASQQRAIQRQLLASCATGSFNADQCCSLQSGSDWNNIAACLCAASDIEALQDLPAFVSSTNVITTCCGYSPLTLGLGRSMPGSAIVDALQSGSNNSSSQTDPSPEPSPPVQAEPSPPVQAGTTSSNSEIDPTVEASSQNDTTTTIPPPSP